MFDSYKDIFNQRGKLYHNAMTKFPMARTEEFRPLINLLEIEKDDIVADIPSGGGYFRNYISPDITVYSIDSAQEFLTYHPNSNRVICAEIDNIPLQNAFFNKIFSLVGIHHLGGCRVMGFVARRVGNRADFFDYLRRIVALRNEKDRKNQPISHRRSRIIHNPTAS